MTHGGRGILVLVGTDHHRFERAVRWADAWQRAHPQDDVFIQHGSASEPRVARGAAFLSPTELRAMVAKADVVITHGGPGTVSDARSQGHHPLLLVRDPAYGEHVDDHQQRFGVWAERRGLGTLAGSTADLDALVSALPARGTRTEPVEEGQASRAAANLERLLAVSGPGASRVAPGSPVVLHVAAADRSSVRRAQEWLGRRPGTVVLGETSRIWTKGLKQDRPCTCGQAFSGCPFWLLVGELAFGGWDAVDTGEVRRLSEVVGARRSAASRRRPGVPLRRDLLEYAAVHRAVYAAALEVSGASVAVDSSDLSTALALSHDRHVDLRLLWLSSVAVGGPAALRRRRVPTVRLRPEQVRADSMWVLRRAADELRLPTGSVGPAMVEHPSVVVLR